MEDLMKALKELNRVVSDFPVGAESTQLVNCDDFDKLEKVFNVKKGELYLNIAYKEDFPVGNSRATSSSSSEAMEDYLKEKYMKECRDLGLRGVVEMLSLEEASVNDGSDDDRKYADIKRRLMKLSQEILEISKEEELENQKLYEEMVSKEMQLQELIYKYQDAALKLKEKREDSPGSLAMDERLEQKARSVLNQINFMRSLTVNLIGSSGVRLSENQDIVKVLLERCQPIRYEDIEKL